MSKKKILVLVPFPMTDDALDNRIAQSKSLELGPDIQIDYRPVKWSGTNFVGPYDYVLGDFTVLEAGLSAQDDGYDAVCIDTMSDSGVAALRAILDIPVIGPGRATFLMAMLLGDKFGILVMWERWGGLYKKVMDELGIWHKFAGMGSVDIPPDRFNLLSGEEEEVFPKLEEAALKLINEKKADVIILGSTSMHQSHAYLSEKLPVPVISPGPLTYKLAEMVLGLGLTHSRTAYPQPVARHDPFISLMIETAAAKAKESEGK